MDRTNAQDREDIIQLGVGPFLIGQTENRLLTDTLSIWLSVHFSLLLEQYGYKRTGSKKQTEKIKQHFVQKPDVDTQEVQHDSRKQLLNSLQMGWKDRLHDIAQL